MDQDAGAGHHVITQLAVHAFFQARAVDGLIDGMTEHQYFALLDHAQAAQDDPMGRTLHSAYADPDVQREHSMADPYRSGDSNLATNRQNLESELGQARATAASDPQGAHMTHLGRAAHEIQDSYSYGHTSRGATVDQGDPEAPILEFNVFDHHPSAPSRGWKPAMGTHDTGLDHVEVRNGDLVYGADRAAEAATERVLETEYDERHQHLTDDQARADTHEQVGRLYHGGEGPVRVNHERDEAWRHEHHAHVEERLREERAFEQAHHPHDATAPPGAPSAPAPEHHDAGAPPGGVPDATAPHN